MAGMLAVVVSEVQVLLSLFLCITYQKAPQARFEPAREWLTASMHT